MIQETDTDENSSDDSGSSLRSVGYRIPSDGKRVHTMKKLLVIALGGIVIAALIEQLIIESIVRVEMDSVSERLDSGRIFD